MAAPSKPLVKALVITGFGLNCEAETACALESAGATVDSIHLNDIVAGESRLGDYHLLAFIGGFSFGDHLGAGTVFANRLRCRLCDQLGDFVGAGKLVIGICNGFQTMTRLGLVPGLGGGFTQEVALAQNAQGVFRDDWVMLQANPSSPCIFTKGIDLVPLPVRHGEGRFVAADDSVLSQLESRNLIALRYADWQTGQPTMDFPMNPNGSTHAIAGICDPTGRVFGMMPHPEAYLSPYNHPDWTRQKLDGLLPESGLGRRIFDNAVLFAERNLL